MGSESIFDFFFNLICFDTFIVLTYCIADIWSVLFCESVFLFICHLLLLLLFFFMHLRLHTVYILIDFFFFCCNSTLTVNDLSIDGINLLYIHFIHYLCKYMYACLGPAIKMVHS